MQSTNEDEELLQQIDDVRFLLKQVISIKDELALIKFQSETNSLQLEELWEQHQAHMKVFAAYWLVMEKLAEEADVYLPGPPPPIDTILKDLVETLEGDQTEESTH